MEDRFNCLVKEDSYQAYRLYHGTTVMGATSIRDRGINLDRCREHTDFNGSRGFYVTANYSQAYKWARNIAKRNGSIAEVVEFNVNRSELKRRFNYKRFEVGEYDSWSTFTCLSRRGRDNKYDIVEGPYKSKDNNGDFIKPQGHQLGIFSKAAARYFDQHVVSSSSQLSFEMEKLSLS